VPTPVAGEGVLAAAELTGTAAELGSLEPGRRADVVVDGDALDDLASLAERIRLVYQDGRLVSTGAAGQ
jgi:imidazolonepropionase-like amidohydrolase